MSGPPPYWPPEDSDDERLPESEAFTLGSFAEVLFPALEAVRPKVVAEIGSYEGRFTAELLDWSGGKVRVIAIDPEPMPELAELEASDPPGLELIREPSHEALRRIDLPDAIVIDGDHNYYTVSEELRLIAEKAGGPSGIPLLIFHDVCWPHARRDTYYAPDRIPEEARQPVAEDGMITPGDPGLADMGLPFPYVAEHEGGPRNGVLTAIEDFMARREGLRFASVPVFFGLGLLWPEDAPWAGEIAEIVAPWDGNPLMERLEKDRIRQMVGNVRSSNMEGLLRAMLGSRAFTWAEWLSRLNQRGEPVFSREELLTVLGDEEEEDEEGKKPKG